MSTLLHYFKFENILFIQDEMTSNKQYLMNSKLSENDGNNILDNDFDMKELKNSLNLNQCNFY